MLFDRLPVVACLLLAVSMPGEAAEPPGAIEMVRDAIERHVVPAYSRFAATTSELHLAVGGLCAAPSQQRLSAARAAFAGAVEAWSRIEVVRLGPVTEENRLERILFWPDRRSTGLKQVQEILADEDSSALDPASLAGKSVAVQGLGALEFALFGTGSSSLGDSAGYRCSYAKAIAGNLDAMAERLDATWTAGDGAAGLWAEPGPENPLFRDGTEALGRLVDVMVHGLELVRDVRINGFLGEEASEDKPRQALFWRSGETIAGLRGNLASIDALLRVSDIEAYLQEDRRWIVQSALFELANAEHALAPLADASLDDILSDPASRAKLDYVRLVTSGLSDLIGRQLSAEFGLTAGFSSLDGD